MPKIPAPDGKRPTVAFAIEIIAVVCAISCAGWIVSGVNAILDDNPAFVSHFTQAGAALVSSVLLWALASIIGLLSRIASGLTTFEKKGILVTPKTLPKPLPNPFQ